jgi:hypothetical protein
VLSRRLNLHGKEKVGGSIPPGGLDTGALTCELTSFALFHGRVVAAITKEKKASPAAVARALTCCNVGAALVAVLQRRQNR